MGQAMCVVIFFYQQMCIFIRYNNLHCNVVMGREEGGGYVDWFLPTIVLLLSFLYKLASLA